MPHWVPANAWGKGSWLGVGVRFNIALTMPLLIAYYARSAALRSAAATVFFVAQAFGTALRVVESDQCQLA